MISTRKNTNKVNYAENTSTGTKLNCVKESLSKILSKIEELTNTNREVEKSVNFCSNKIDKFDEKLNMLSNISDDLEKRINHVETYCKNIMSDVEQIKAYNYLNRNYLLTI